MTMLGIESCATFIAAGLPGKPRARRQPPGDEVADGRPSPAGRGRSRAYPDRTARFHSNPDPEGGPAYRTATPDIGAQPQAEPTSTVLANAVASAATRPATRPKSMWSLPCCLLHAVITSSASGDTWASKLAFGPDRRQPCPDRGMPGVMPTSSDAAEPGSSTARAVLTPRLATRVARFHSNHDLEPDPACPDGYPGRRSAACARNPPLPVSG